MEANGREASYLRNFNSRNTSLKPFRTTGSKAKGIAEEEIADYQFLLSSQVTIRHTLHGKIIQLTVPGIRLSTVDVALVICKHAIELICRNQKIPRRLL